MKSYARPRPAFSSSSVQKSNTPPVASEYLRSMRSLSMTSGSRIRNTSRSTSLRNLYDGANHPTRLPLIACSTRSWMPNVVLPQRRPISSTLNRLSLANTSRWLACNMSSIAGSAMFNQALALRWHRWRHPLDHDARDVVVLGFDLVDLPEHLLAEPNEHGRIAVCCGLPLHSP